LLQFNPAVVSRLSRHFIQVSSCQADRAVTVITLEQKKVTSSLLPDSLFREAVSGKQRKQQYTVNACGYA